MNKLQVIKVTTVLSMFIVSFLGLSTPKPVHYDQAPAIEVQQTDTVKPDEVKPQEPVATPQAVTTTQQVSQVTNEPAEPPVAEPVPDVEPFDAKEYATTLLQDRASMGYGVNSGCYYDLISEAHGWNLSKAEVDQVASKIFTYSSTCTAYAQYVTKGSY